MVARRRRNTQHPHINCASRSFMSRRRRASFLQLYKVARHYWLIRRAGHAMLWRLGGELFADIKIPLGSFRYITRTVSWMQNVFGYWSPKSMYSEVVDIHFFFIRFHVYLPVTTNLFDFLSWSFLSKTRRKRSAKYYRKIFLSIFWFW